MIVNYAPWRTADYFTESPTVVTQQLAAKKMLGTLRAGQLQCFVAGGAARDWYLGRVAKDIDICIQSIGLPDDSQRKFYEGLGLTAYIKGPPENYSLNPNLESVMDCVLDGHIFQFLVFNDLDRVIEEFPLSICQISWDGSDFNVTENFQKTVETKTIFKTNTPFGAGQAYLDRIAGKFPDYKREGW